MDTFTTMDEQYMKVSAGINAKLQVVCVHVGTLRVPGDKNGGYITPPRKANGLPLLNVFMRKNLPYITQQGWEPYNPPAKPTTKKTSRTKTPIKTEE